MMSESDGRHRNRVSRVMGALFSMFGRRVAGNSRRHRGTALTYVTVAAAVIIGLCSLASDYGHVQLVKTELQQAADLSARAAAGQLFWGVSAAENAAVTYAAANKADGTAVVLEPANNIQFGRWNGGAFTVLTGSARVDANAVRVTVNRSVPLLWGSLIGMTECDTSASAIATELPLNHGVVGLEKFEISGGAFVDSYTSDDGAYSSTKEDTARAASNSDIKLSGSNVVIRGDARPGPGRRVDPARAVTGSTTPLTEALSYIPPTAGSAATSNNNSHFGSYINGARDVSISSQVNVVVAGGLYYLKSLSVSGQATLTFSGPAVVYITDSVSLSGGTVVYGNKPGNFRLRVIGGGGVNISGSNALYCDVYSPQSVVSISGNGGLYGAVVGRELNVSGNGGIHHDLSITSARATTLVR